MFSNYEILIRKLDNFKRRYYLNLLIKGFLLTGISFFLLTVVLAVLENIGYFGSFTRAILYFSFLLIILSLLTVYVFIPLTAILKLRKIIDDESAGEILGNYFKSEIKDKIINAIQLEKLRTKSSFGRELIIASIEQKSKELIVFPFKKAIDIRKNKKYLFPTISLMIIFFAGWYLYPDALQHPARRIINFNVEFLRPAPFEIKVINEYPLKGYIDEDFTLEVMVLGEILPTALTIVYDDTKIQMVETGRGVFNYRFRSLSHSIKFRIEANGFLFGPFELTTENRAKIKDIVLFIEYPSYTEIKNEKIYNISDIAIPEGSLLTWNIFTDFGAKLHVKGCSIEFDQKTYLINSSGKIELERKFHESEEISFFVEGTNGSIGDSISFKVSVIKDRFPLIIVEDVQDSIYLSRVYFQGLISDDYGFSILNAHYLIDKGKYKEEVIVPFEIDNNILRQNFYHWIEINTFGLDPGDQIKVFFEVADNDLHNGYKRSRSNYFYYRIPEINELIYTRIQKDYVVSSTISRSINRLSLLQHEIDNLRREIVNSDNVTWTQREKIKDLLNKQKELIRENELIKQFAEESAIKSEQFRQINNEILQKQDELKSLIDQTLTDEMKELYERIAEELEKLDRNEVFNMLEKMQFEMSDLENRLDRVLELFKRFQVERLIEESIEAVESVRKKQVELNENLNEKGITEELSNEQSKIKEDFVIVRDLLARMREENDKLRRPNQLESTLGKEEFIERGIDESINQVGRNNRNRANESQRDVIGGLEDLASGLRQIQEAMHKHNVAEDIRSLRIILDNLIKTSFSQENLIAEFNFINLRDPKYAGLIREQRKIKDDLTLIQDSLKSLAERQPQIKSFVIREIEEIKFNINEAVGHLLERRKQSGIMRQQYVMTHVNNLALLLNESMKNLQAMMQSMENGNGMAGKGEEYGIKDLREMQEQMNRMLEQLKEGHVPLPGQGIDITRLGFSEQLARLAAEQEAIRNKLNQLAIERKSVGNDAGDYENIMREMEKTEIDILSNNVNRDTQLRQQQILTRLLEHERAEVKRDLDEKRAGETAKSKKVSNPDVILEYKRVRNRDFEMIRKVPLLFRLHYRSISENYFKNID